MSEETNDQPEVKKEAVLGEEVEDMVCTACGQHYIWGRDFVPGGGGGLQPEHRCPIRSQGVSLRRIVRRLG
mgnify:CR=1 FL=1|jgi:hypothetical protein|tara:strand:- start:1569 stop:1781 length:213 start_codon:yes stop_codon:yes gene_type:complete